MSTTRVLRHFDGDTGEAVQALADVVERRTGVSPFADDTWRALRGTSAGDVGLLVADGDGAAGYAHLARLPDHGWSLEVAGRDDADDVVGDLVADAVEEVAAAGGGHVTFWAHGASPDSDRVAAQHGFAPERELLQMRVALPLPEPPGWPEGVSVRTFRAGDEHDWVEVNNRAFAGHPEQGGWTVEVLRAREAEAWFDPEGFLLAFDAEGLAGFCWTKVHDADPPREPDALGEIYVIGADPRWHGRGLGRALTTGGLASLAARGIRVGMLYVDGANGPAVGLYRALGFTDHRVDRAYGRDVAPRSDQ